MYDVIESGYTSGARLHSAEAATSAACRRRGGAAVTPANRRVSAAHSTASAPHTHKAPANSTARGVVADPGSRTSADINLTSCQLNSVDSSGDYVSMWHVTSEIPFAYFVY